MGSTFDRGKGYVGKIRAQTIVTVEQVLWHDMHRTDDWHEIRIADPTWDGMPVEMVSDTRARGGAEIESDVHTLWVQRVLEKCNRLSERVHEIREFDFR